jgi:hypothetical protein
MSFTPEKSDLTNFESIADEDLKVMTAGGYKNESS